MALNEIFMEAMTLDVRLLFYMEMKPPEGSWRRIQNPTCAKSGIVQNWGLVGAYGPHISEPSIKQPSERSRMISIPGLHNSDGVIL